jgi:hypothetical protein
VCARLHHPAAVALRLSPHRHPFSIYSHTSARFITESLLTPPEELRGNSAKITPLPSLAPLLLLCPRQTPCAQHPPLLRCSTRPAPRTLTEAHTSRCGSVSTHLRMSRQGSTDHKDQQPQMYTCKGCGLQDRVDTTNAVISLIVIIKGRSPLEVSLIVIINQVSS